MANFMERYLNISPSGPKKRKTEDQKREQQRNYDRYERERGFLPKWKTDRPWLMYTENCAYGNYEFQYPCLFFSCY